MVCFPSFCSFGDNSVLFRYCLVQRPFCIFLLFSSDLWSGIFFPFFAFSHSSIGNFLFLFSSKGKDWHSYPGSRFMVNWDFGSRLVARLHMIYVRVWFSSRIKRNVPHYFHDTNATMMIWKFYAKLVLYAPMWTLKCRNFLVMWC